MQKPLKQINMKKNLLTLSFLVACISTYAQDTYIGDKAIVKVQPNTLFYNGGNVKLAPSQAPGTALTNIVLNEGNIQIEGNFENTITNSKGEHFTNLYNSSSSYGQLIIKSDSEAEGAISIERPKIDITTNDYFPFGLPFQNENMYSVIENITGVPNSFSGDCKVDVVCSNRYNNTILVWDIAKTEYDAVPKLDGTNTNFTQVIPGSNYTIKVNGGEIRNFITSLGNTVNKFPIYGTPNNKDLKLQGIESGIKGVNKATFSEYKWSEWKNKKNNYGEEFKSYLGAGVDTNARYAKNLHRFSNPFTSNIDLSDVSKTNSWIEFVLGNNSIQKPTEIYTTTLRFKVTKLPENYQVNWNNNTGSTNIGDPRISAYLQKNEDVNDETPYFWAGNPDALLIKPLEYFEIDYYTLSKNRYGSNIVKANINITDNQKTFIQSFNGTDQPIAYARNSYGFIGANDENLKKKGLISGNDFTQVEFFITKDNSILGEAAYLVNSSSYKTGDAISSNISNNNIFLYEEDIDGNVIEDAHTLLNQFNTNDYIGKPLRIGFNNLNEGESYQINLRLFEISILNQVDTFNSGTYYLLDKSTNNVSELNSNNISFIADENSNNRFELFWKEHPKTLGTSDLVNTATYIYKNNANQFVKFENNNTTAQIEIFDISGRLISTYKNVSTSNDFRIDVNKNSGVYVVVITYKDGKVVKEKALFN